MESKSSSIGSIVGILVLCVVLYYGTMAISNTTKMQTGIHYLQTGQMSLDLHALARQDATNEGIDPNLFERQINQESGFNPNAVSPAGAIGIAQFMPSTARGLGINPWDAAQSLSGAAAYMARLYTRYQSYDKALAAYNAGSDSVNTAISNCGANWRGCVPSETDRYIRAITGG